jgi:large repetitive protein
MAAVTIAGMASASAQTFTLTIQPNTLPPSTQGVPYNHAVTAVGGNSNYALSIGSGALPAGLSLTGAAGT